MEVSMKVILLGRFLADLRETTVFDDNESFSPCARIVQQRSTCAPATQLFHQQSAGYSSATDSNTTDENDELSRSLTLPTLEFEQVTGFWMHKCRMHKPFDASTPLQAHQQAHQLLGDISDRKTHAAPVFADPRPAKRARTDTCSVDFGLAFTKALAEVRQTTVWQECMRNSHSISTHHQVYSLVDIDELPANANIAAVKQASNLLSATQASKSIWDSILEDCKRAHPALPGLL